MIAIPLVILVAAAFAFLFVFLFEMRDELDAHLKPMFQQMAESGWRENTFAPYASPSFQTRMKRNDFDSVTEGWRRLGPIVEYQGLSEFQVNKDADGSGSATGSVGILFATGARTFTVELERIGGRWYLASLRLVDS
jgi:hypothetical protein